jgi:hypothetical protein
MEPVTRNVAPASRASGGAMKKFSLSTKDMLVTVALYASILVPMFIMIRDPEPDPEAVSAAMKRAVATPKSVHFVQLKAVSQARLKSNDVNYIDYHDDIGIYVDEYPQYLMKGKATLKVGGLKLIVNRYDILGVAAVSGKDDIPAFGDIEPLKMNRY